ncbi:MAG: KdsC family phosphatase [Cryomorphaceae bacterium]|nr:HAD hydrolase family protein [Flavobacteriales bacterium]
MTEITTKSYKELLPSVNTFIFDVDGVFTNGMVHIMPDGLLLRQLSVKDSYAIQYAIKKEYRIAIITGGNSMAVRDGLQSLGIQHIFLESKNKEKVYRDFAERESLNFSEILYMGDDIPDYDVMKLSGVAACPADASQEIKQISNYVSHKKGGEGCVRDIIEQTLRVQGKWFDKDALEW